MSKKQRKKIVLKKKTSSKNAPFESIKKATVAMAFLHYENKQQPFTILGSGFCIHKSGVVVTCSHVVEAFFKKSFDEYIASIKDEEKKKQLQNIPNVQALVAHALFYQFHPDKKRIMVIPVQMDVGTVQMDFDLGLIRLQPHNMFPKGYPTVQFEDFNQLHEGMDISTCGFPLGSFLQKSLGTVTSSFTRGIISSMIPALSTRMLLEAFQLDLRATHGNSGGPVFSLVSGKVFGVLQGGIDDDYGNPLFSRAESIYRLLDSGAIEDILSMKNPYN